MPPVTPLAVLDSCRLLAKADDNFPLDKLERMLNNYNLVVESVREVENEEQADAADAMLIGLDTSFHAEVNRELLVYLACRLLGDSSVL